MDSLLPFYPVIVSLCEKLSFQELKSLSLTSKGWWEATDSFMIKRALLNMNKPCGIEFFRKYKFVRISKVDLKDVIVRIPDSTEEINLETSGIDSFKQFLKFKRLKNLTVDNFSLPQVTPTPTELTLGLQSLRANATEKSVSLLQTLIGANSSMESLSLEFSTYNYGLYKKDFKVFIKNIHLPKLLTFSITGFYFDFKDELIEFFEKHKDLKDCSLNGLEVNTQVVKSLRRNCRNLERLSLETCVGLEPTQNTSNELKLMTKLKHLDLSYTSFTVADLEKLHSRQLQTFKMAFIWVTTPQAKSILQSMRYLRVLDISQCQGDLDSSILPYIAETMPQLVDLTLRELELCCNGSNKQSYAKFERLEKLEMSCSESTFCSLRAPRLRIFTSNNSDIGSNGIRLIVDSSPLLEELTLNNYEIVESDMEYIATNLHHLRRLQCEINKQGLKVLLTKTCIEECRLFTRIEDLNEVAKWKEGFEAFEYSEHSRVQGGGLSKRIITNGARTLFFI